MSRRATKFPYLFPAPAPASALLDYLRYYLSRLLLLLDIYQFLERHYNISSRFGMSASDEKTAGAYAHETSNSDSIVAVKGGTEKDGLDMYRMGKLQQLRVHFPLHSLTNARISIIIITNS